MSSMKNTNSNAPLTTLDHLAVAEIFNGLAKSSKEVRNAYRKANAKTKKAEKSLRSAFAADAYANSLAEKLVSELSTSENVSSPIQSQPMVVTTRENWKNWFFKLQDDIESENNADNKEDF